MTVGPKKSRLTLLRWRLVRTSAGSAAGVSPGASRAIPSAASHRPAGGAWRCPWRPGPRRRNDGMVSFRPSPAAVSARYWACVPTATRQSMQPSWASSWPVCSCRSFDWAPSSSMSASIATRRPAPVAWGVRQSSQTGGHACGVGVIGVIDDRDRARTGTAAAASPARELATRHRRSARRACRAGCRSPRPPRRWSRCAGRTSAW